jgi:hypothetical protein
MYVAAGDHKPDSLFDRRPVDWMQVVIGAATAVSVYGTFGALLLLVHILTPSLARGTHADVLFDTKPPEVEMLTYEEVRLIKLGRQFDPRELPNRIREARSQAPSRPSMVARHDAERVPIPDAGPLNALEALNQRIGTTADEQAQIARNAEQEGDPDGVAEGTYDADEGDRYGTYLYGFFRRGLVMPTSITDEERRGLRAIVSVTTTPSGQIESYRITRPSGNSDYDNAVRIRMDQAVGSQLRDPPDDKRDEYFGTSFPIGIRPPR